MKRKQITVLLDAEEFELFDAFCHEKGFKKSTLIVRLIRNHLDSERFRRQRPLPLEETSTGDR